MGARLKYSIYTTYGPRFLNTLCMSWALGLVHTGKESSGKNRPLCYLVNPGNWVIPNTADNCSPRSRCVYNPGMAVASTPAMDDGPCVMMATRCLCLLTWDRLAMWCAIGISPVYFIWELFQKGRYNTLLQLGLSPSSGLALITDDVILSNASLNATEEGSRQWYHKHLHDHQ